MGVYIKGMEMPASCPCELLGNGYDLYCSFAGGIPARVKEYYECCQNGTRPSWCPLVPISQHGRLIDADALEEDFNIICSLNCPYPDTKKDCGSCLLNVTFTVLAEAHNVVEAEEGET